MTVDLTIEEIETLLTSLDYSKQHVRDAPETPYEVRRENLSRLDAVATKLREVRKG
jgi:hypothetical protein